MKVQLIGYNSKGIDRAGFPNVVISPLSAPGSLDEFDVNVINLSAEDVWVYDGNSISSINWINHFKSIQKMVERKATSKIVYQFPQNVRYKYYKSGDRYYQTALLKDMLAILQRDLLSKILPSTCKSVPLLFEPTHTMLKDKEYIADFYIDEAEVPAITESIRSKKMTTMELEKDSIYVTTLNISNSEVQLKTFLSYLFEPKEKEVAPDWVKDITVLDDVDQQNAIRDNQEKIEEAKTKIERAEKKLSENAEYKSILYTNGDELVSVVFKILEKLLNCDLSGFVDKGKEDFLVQLSTCTFIGEIKGITSNVKNENVSQIELHYQGYMDKLAEEGQEEHVHQLLIINPFRTKPLQDRERVNQQQIDLAKRNGCLIIETNTLLRIFEKFCREEITVAQCVATFSNCTGLLQLSDFEKIDPDTLEPYKT